MPGYTLYMLNVLYNMDGAQAFSCARLAHIKTRAASGNARWPQLIRACGGRWEASKHARP
jgi:hypothetical protein